MLVNLGASRTRYVSQRLTVHEINVEKNGVSALVEYLDGKILGCVAWVTTRLKISRCFI